MHSESSLSVSQQVLTQIGVKEKTEWVGHVCERDSIDFLVLEATARWSDLASTLVRLFSLLFPQVTEKRFQIGVLSLYLVSLKIAESVSEQDHLLFNLNEEAHVIFFKELFCQTDVHVVAVVNVDAPALRLQHL